MSDAIDRPKRRRGRAAAIGLTKAQVVAAAIEQIDNKGLSGFSLRELARSLGVSPTVIYWHVGGRQEDLFAEISAVITASLAEGLTEYQDPKLRLREVFLRYRELVLKHPKVAPLLGAQMKSNGVANLIWVETVLSALSDMGFKDGLLRDAFNSLIGGLAGFVTMELAPPPAGDSSGWQEVFADRVKDISPENYPCTHAALPTITNQIFVLRWQNGEDISYAGSFEFLLDLLLDGLERRAQRLHNS
ncbi:TetR family transcriptional regulator [uncultured Marinobacter sp.]|uniref:TetR/AcrR family transcriptional regulator n=1 Tax=uncultured Marinobacter sp. TaxID=187379 RepID=UPI0025D8EC33|nr:TetR family transcriptional regulator [uncultured Marinobacter sp.]